MRKCLSNIFGCSLLLPIFALGTANAMTEQKVPIQNLPIEFKAEEVLPNNLLSGSNFSVGNTVTNDGFFYSYQFNANGITTKVESSALLIERINEQHALKQMKAAKKTEAFQEGLKKSAMAPVELAKGLVTKPVDTVSNVGSGVVNWFGDVSRAITSDDPHQDNALKTAFGYSTTKRQFAYEFDINPYTSNKAVQDELSNISQTAFAGGVIPKAVFGAIDGGVGTALSVTSTANSMKKLVRDKSPSELEKINTTKLQKMGVPEYLIKGFLTNRHFDPYDETLLVGELESMENVSNRKLLIAEAATADSPEVAFYLRKKYQMMAQYNGEVAKFERVEQLDGRTAVGIRKDGTLILLTLADYVPFSNILRNKEESVSKAINNIKEVRSKELWVSGTFSTDARKVMEEKGWIIVESSWDKLSKK